MHGCRVLTKMHLGYSTPVPATWCFMRKLSKSIGFDSRISQRLSSVQKSGVRNYGISQPAWLGAIDSQPNSQETVEAVFVFHRHGDRTPGKSLLADEVGDDESKFWKTKIPSAFCYDVLCERFPAVRQNQDSKDNNHRIQYESFRETLDGNRSYGFLTWKGLHQMYHNGLSMAWKYSPAGGDSVSFGDFWDIKAMSTNYLRTVMSCQALLDGLLTENNHPTGNDIPRNYHYPTHYEFIPLEDYRTNHTCDDKLEILVRDKQSETLNAFESSPALMKQLMREVFATPEFIAKDQQAKSLKSQLIEYLPGLTKHSTYAEMPSSLGDDINWIHAADHFVCRSSHSVDVQQFCPHLQGDQNQQELRFQELGAATLSHLQERFHGFYSDPRLLGEMAGPALHEVLMELKTAVKNKDSLSSKTKKPFRIYSCHDVTILALIYAIEGIHLDSTKSFLPWPTYATCFTLELVRTAENDESEPRYSLRAFINKAPIPNYSPSPVAFATVPGAQPSFSIDLSMFENLVRDVNDARVPKEIREQLASLPQ